MDTYFFKMECAYRYQMDICMDTTNKNGYAIDILMDTQIEQTQVYISWLAASPADVLVDKTTVAGVDNAEVL